jgi:Spy/CpxP family protein refolding chaperone
MKRKNFISCVVAVQLIAGAAISASAQSTNSPSPAPPANRPFPVAPGRFAEGLRPFIGVLTDEQRASLEPAFREERDQLMKLEMKLRETRKEMLSAGLNGSFNEDAVRKQAQAAAEIEVEIDVLRVKALSQIQPPLSAEQIEKIQNAASGPAGGLRLNDRPANRRALTNTNRDENDLPPKL